jgi:hypothetical protein
MLQILLSLCLPLKILGASIFSYAAPKARWEQQGNIVLRSGPGLFDLTASGVFELNMVYTSLPTPAVPAIETAKKYAFIKSCAYETIINQPNICKQRK